MKKVLIGIGISLLCVVLLVGALALVANAYVAAKSSDDIPESVELSANEFGTVTAVGRGLYDENGKRFEIKGINFGNLFIAEGWMTVNSIGAIYCRKYTTLQAYNKQKSKCHHQFLIVIYKFA